VVAINANEATMGYNGTYNWQEHGVKQSIFFLCIWHESGFSHCEDVFTFNLLRKKSS
jgi:hypothetical protein